MVRTSSDLVVEKFTVRTIIWIRGKKGKGFWVNYHSSPYLDQPFAFFSQISAGGPH